MMSIHYSDGTEVNCRIGSLEIEHRASSTLCVVNCRIGSLEIADILDDENNDVNCRIGSLESADALRILLDLLRKLMFCCS